MSRIDSAHAHRAARAARSRRVLQSNGGRIVSAAALVAAALAAACGGSSAAEVSERYGVANQLSGSTYGQAGASGAGPSGQAGMAGTGGGAAMPPPMPAEPAAPDAPSGPPQECNGPNIASGVFGTPAPADGLLIDFGTYTTRTTAGGGAWGDMGLRQITGGTSVYSGDTASALTIVVENEELHLTATMAAPQAYTGVVLWFSPCVNASAFRGLTFPVSGDLGGATMLVKAQTSPDYPVDVTNAKGKCEYPREDMKFTTCQQPTVTIDELSQSPFALTWAEFTGGTPVATLDPAQLLGFELQFQCQAGNCALDVSVGDVRFIAP